MLVRFLAALAGACVLTLVASVVLTWGSRWSALWSMAVGGLLAVVALLSVLLIAWLLTRMAFPT